MKAWNEQLSLRSDYARAGSSTLPWWHICFCSGLVITNSFKIRKPETEPSDSLIAVSRDKSCLMTCASIDNPAYKQLNTILEVQMKAAISIYGSAVATFIVP